MPKDNKRKRLGEILIDQGVLTREGLDRALAVQKQEGGLLGAILSKLHLVTEEDIVIALATQFNYPYLPIENFAVNPEVVKLIPEELIKRYVMMPIDRLNNVLTVVMADPSNEEAIRELESVSHCRVQAFVGTVTEIEKAIKKHYKTIKFDGALKPDDKVTHSFQKMIGKSPEDQKRS